MATTTSETKKSESGSSKDAKSGKQHQQQKQKSKGETNFFRNELEKVKENVDRYNASLKPPPQEPFVPYIFNPLKPYSDTRMFETAINEPPESQHFPVSRNTALGPCDPWISLDMDLRIPPSTPSTARQSARQDSRQNSSRGGGGEEGNKTNRSAKEKEDTADLKMDLFPTVKPQPSHFHGKTLHYGQVQELRLELKRTYSAEAQRKIDDEYQKTKKYFYSRQLDKMDDYRSISRNNMRATYFAYLQNNPGSKKAVYECVHNSEQKADKKADKEKTEERKETDKKSEKADKEQTTGSNKTRDSKDGRSKEKEPQSQKPTSKNKTDGVRSGDSNKNSKNSSEREQQLDSSREREQLLEKNDENYGKSEDKGNAKNESNNSNKENQKKEQPAKK